MHYEAMRFLPYTLQKYKANFSNENLAGKEKEKKLFKSLFVPIRFQATVPSTQYDLRSMNPYPLADSNNNYMMT